MVYLQELAAEAPLAERTAQLWLVWQGSFDDFGCGTPSLLKHVKASWRLLPWQGWGAGWYS